MTVYIRPVMDAMDIFIPIRERLICLMRNMNRMMRPIEEGCQCPTCRRYSRAYVRHLLKAKEMLGMRLCVLHNLYFYNTDDEEIRDAIDAGSYKSYKEEKLYGMNQINRKKRHKSKKRMKYRENTCEMQSFCVQCFL